MLSRLAFPSELTHMGHVTALRFKSIGLPPPSIIRRGLLAGGPVWVWGVAVIHNTLCSSMGAGGDSVSRLAPQCLGANESLPSKQLSITHETLPRKCHANFSHVELKRFVMRSCRW